jgi:5,10-methylenetetrahydromethanopterin reductase
MDVGFGMMGSQTPERFRAIVGLAERRRYAQLWIADEALYRNVYALLAAAALSSVSIRLGTAVTNPFTRHPALTAAAVATVDELSAGRVVLGLGAGGSALVALGIERDRPVDAVRDAVGIVNGLTGTGRVEYQGRRWSYTGRLNFAPLRRVPVIIAARGPQMLQLAGEIADGVMIGGVATAPGIRRALAHVEAGRRRGGRGGPFEVVSWLYTSIADDRARAVKAVARIVAVSLINSRHSLADLGIDLPGAIRDVMERHAWRRSDPLIEAVMARLTDDLIDAFAITGPAPAVRSRIAALEPLGITQAALLFFPPDGSSVEEQLDHYASDGRRL